MEASIETRVTGAEPEQYLAFSLGGEAFAMGIAAILEVVPLGHLTPVPLMPPDILGVINLRGSVVPVLDLAVRLGRPPTQRMPRTCIVILELRQDGARSEWGVLVDSVREVLSIGVEAIEPAPAFGPTLRTDLLAGVFRDGDRFVLLLATDRIFDAAAGAA